MLPTESKCEKWGLHRFTELHNYKDALVEVCDKCGKRMVYPKRFGKINMKEQLKYHARDLLQPIGKYKREFAQEYGYSLTGKGKKEEQKR